MSTYTPIATQTLGGATTTVTFSSLPQNYTDLIIVIDGATTGAGANITLQAGNGALDTGSNYSARWLVGDGSSATSSSQSNQTNALMGAMYSGRGNLTIQLQNYANSATFKTFIGRTNTAASAVGAYIGLWRSTAPINILSLTAGGTTWITGTTFSVYGIAAGNASAKASGGNIVTTDGTYWYHAFTSTGVFTPSSALTADYVVVAGGAGGGYSQGGGGGAGGVLSVSSGSLSANTAYLAVVGAGGAGSTSQQSFGANGTNSIFISSTAIGGGGGATGGNSGQNGGSGGGAGNGGTPGTGTVGQGNNGGTAYNGGNFYGGGGGGGAGAAGGNGSSGAGGNGGAGVNTWSSWLSSLGLGVSGFIAGGGGAGTFTGGTAGTGGSGGGGNAGVSTSGQAGFPAVANTGSGGGGSSYGPSFPGSAGPGGNGASGLILIRYAV